jgi:probable HAF family extracellular repeat protein
LGVCQVQAVEYEVIILGTLGGERSYAYAINDSGQVVGQSFTADSQARAFLWDKDNGMQDLGVLEIPGNPGRPYYSCATGINNSGQVVGYSGYADGPEYAFLWENGHMSSLGTLGGRKSSAAAINNRGQIVGSSTNLNGNTRAFLWDNGIMQDIDTLEGRTTHAYGINDHAQVVGEFYKPSNEHFNGCTWVNGLFTDLGEIDEYGSLAEAINNSGIIVGRVTFRREGGGIVSQAVKWENYQMINLGYLEYPESFAHAINDSGQIVGSSRVIRGNSSHFHACLWQNGEIIDLTHFSPEEAPSQAYDINSSGQVVGYVEMGGTYRAFLMTPIPEPSTRWVPSQYPTIQAAIDAAVNGDTVVVAPGTYTGDGNRDINFKGKAITVRGATGDPNDCVIDCQGTETAPHRGFKFVRGEESNSVLDGITITNGYGPQEDVMGNGYFYSIGGAVYCKSSSPNISNCIIKNSSASSGGGISNHEAGTPIINNCYIIDNLAINYGGGIYNERDWPGSAVISNCIIRGNSAAWGGGIASSLSSPTINTSIISNNSASAYGGGIYNNISNHPTINNSIIRNNSASHYGGGFFNSSSTLAMSNCVISSNSAVENGGGSLNEYNSVISMDNCTVVDNSAGYGGGISNYSSGVIMNNCIIWDNIPSQLAGGYPSTVIASYCDIQGGYSGTGNINADSRFANPDINDYHLLPDSPCINAGDPNYVAGPNETDIDGEARVMLGRVDMGSDEFNPFEASFDVVGRRRISRTIFEYECSVILRNIWRFAVRNVQLEIVKASENMVIIDPDVIFGDVEFGPGESATSIDTCTFQVDRSKAIDPAKIIWWCKSEIADTGQTEQYTSSSIVILEPEATIGDGKVDLEDLAKLVGRWLWVGEAGSIPEDITSDGIVNLRDFAVLAATGQ